MDRFRRIFYTTVILAAEIGIRRYADYGLWLRFATWAVTGCDPYELKDTVFNFLYNSKIDDILPGMQKYIKDYSEIHKALSSETIVRHEYIGDLSVAEYSNGWKIVCNYGETEQTYNDISIAQLDYQVIK